MVILISLAVIFADQLSKFFVSKNLSLHESLPVLKGILYLSLVHNRGAAFGIFKGSLSWFIFTALFAIALILFDLKRERLDKLSLYTFSLALILGGAAGNLLDRLRFGYVVDFLDFRVWPVFNVADSAITIGAILLGICILSSAK
jgi:signal peptidase II